MAPTNRSLGYSLKIKEQGVALRYLQVEDAFSLDSPKKAPTKYIHVDLKYSH